MFSDQDTQGTDTEDKTKKQLIEGIESLRRQVAELEQEKSECKQVEEALGKSLAKHGSLVNNVKLGIFRSTPEPLGRFLEVNPAMEEISGYSREELLQMNVSDLYAHPEERQAVLEEIASAAGKTTKELSFKKKDGSEILVSDTKVAVKDDAGKVLYFDGIVEDITKRKRAEEKLKESERRYRLLFETSPDYIAQVDKEGRFFAANPAMAGSFGIPVEELIGKTLFEVMPQQIAQRRLAMIIKALDEEQPQIFEDEREGKHLHNIIVPVEIPGQKETVLVVARDITEHKQAEEALRESKQRTKAMLESIGDHISMMDKDLNIIWANDVAKRIFGDDIVGKKCYAAYHKRTKPCEPYPCLTLRAFQDGKVHEHDTQVIGKDGKIVDFHCTANVALWDKDDKPAAVIEISRDITEHKRAEEALRESEERYRTTFEHTGTAIAILEEDTTISLVNSQFERLSQYSREEIEGKMSWTKLVHRDDLQRMIQYHRKRREKRDGVPDEYEFRAVDKNGEVRYALLNVDMIPGTKKSLISVIEITDRKRTEEELKHSFINLAETVSRAIESRDPYTSGHQRRVAELAGLVGEKMGLDDDRLQGLYIGGLLHDIGKISTPESILSKPGELSEEEWNLIRAHAKRGYEILKDSALPWSVADMALHHHERLDGSGYPHGISGDKLSLENRILGVCDVVEAMSSHRPYRPARSREEVVEEIKSGRGTKYDADVVDVMMQILENGEFEFGWIEALAATKASKR